MNIGAVSQGIMDIGSDLGTVQEAGGSGSFFQNVEKALSTMNTVSLNDEQDALDLGEFGSAVVSLIMSFYANGGNMVELQDAQKMADIILGSNAMLDLLSYNEVTLNDIFLSNLNGGVLSGSDNLSDRIAEMDFSELIDAINQEISSDIDLTKDMSQLITKVMDEIEAGVNQNAENVKLNEANALFDVVGKLRVDSDNKENTAVTLNHEDESNQMGVVKTVQEDEGSQMSAVKTTHEDESNQMNVIKTSQEDRIHTGKKTDYSGEVKDKTANINNNQGIGAFVNKIDRAQITLERPIESTNLAGSVLEIMETSITNGTDSLFIKLKPDFLGGIAIKLAMSEGGVVAKIVTSSSQTQNMLASQIANLESALRDKGIDVARMEVLYNPLNQDGQKQSGNNQEHSRNGSSHRFEVEEADDNVNLQYFQLMGEYEEPEDGVYNA